MQRIGRVLKALFTLFLIYAIAMAVVLAVLFFAPQVWSPPLLRKLESQAHKRLGVTLTAEQLKVTGIWPFTLQFEKIGFHQPTQGIKGDIQSLRLTFALQRLDGNWAQPKVDVGIQFIGLRVQSYGQVAEVEASATQAPGQPAAPMFLFRPVGVDFGFRVSVEQGAVQLDRGGTPIVVDKIQSQLELPSMRSALWRPTLRFQGELGTDFRGLRIRQPIELSVTGTEMGADAIQITTAQAKVAQLPFQTFGFYEFTSNSFQVRLKLLGADLSQVPVSFLPAGEWKGAFSGELLINREGNRPLIVRGDIRSESLHGQVNFKQDDMVIRGDLKGNLSTRFVYHESLQLDDLTLQTDLSGAEISIPPWFAKAPGTELYADVVADGRGEVVNLRRASVALAHLKILGVGQMNLTNPTQMALQVSWPLTQLAGLEKNILPLNQAPLSGQLRGELQLSGPPGNPKELVMDLKMLELQNVAGALDFKTESFAVSGPFVIQGEVAAQVSGMQLEMARGQLGIDLSKMAIRVADQYQKPSPWPLKINLNANWAQRRLALNQLTVSGMGGDARLTGTLGWERLKVPLNLRLSLDRFNIASWLSWWKVPPLSAGGLVNGTVDLRGSFNFGEGFLGSPMRLKGNLAWREGALMIPESPPVPAPPASAPNKTEPEEVKALLPNWPILRTLDLNLALALNSLTYGKLALKQTEAKGRFVGGQFTGDFKVGQVFGGNVIGSKIILSPLVAPPTLEAQAKWALIQMEPLLTWLSPKLKGYMVGTTKGSLSSLGVLPTSAAAIQHLRAEGDWQIENGQFLTWQFEDKINERLSQAGIGQGKTVKTKPVPFQLQSRFDLNDGLVQVSRFRLITADRDELKLQGNVKLNLELELSGSAMVAGHRFRGAVAAANADESGRLVVPLQIRGNVLNPEFSFASTTLKSMAAKTIEKEAESLKSRARTELEKAKDKAGDDLKKKIKGLLGK